MGFSHFKHIKANKIKKKVEEVFLKGKKKIIMQMIKKKKQNKMMLKLIIKKILNKLILIQEKILLKLILNTLNRIESYKFLLLKLLIKIDKKI